MGWLGYDIVVSIIVHMGVIIPIGFTNAIFIDAERENAPCYIVKLNRDLDQQDANLKNLIMKNASNGISIESMRKVDLHVVFDLLHESYCNVERGKENCDYLIVGLQTDPSIDRQEKNQPVQSVYERYMQLQAVKYVDEIIPYDTEQSLIDLLESTEIHLRFVGRLCRQKFYR